MQQESIRRRQGTVAEALPQLELWGGIECTINRIGDSQRNQCDQSGFGSRHDDISRIASLGLRTLRCPVLWEQVERVQGEFDWTGPDRMLEAIGEHGIRPVAGLLHHGSGPLWTDLLDPSFPYQFAEYARRVAARYPWIDLYAPVNEPLTTARFSCLYGLWHPHHESGPSFVQAMIHQMKATVLAMLAIRSVNPDAGLVQTEDLGKVHSAESVAAQAAFENDRRWLTWDLLTGEWDRSPLMAGWLLAQGAEVAALNWFKRNACPPDIMGVNYYVTSERYLDDRLHHYPESQWGGNGDLSYADVEAVRVLSGGFDGPESILLQAWERYGLPLAVTECHLGSTPEQQVRWLEFVLDAAVAARRQGASVQAVTSWALFGSFDWDTLLCRQSGHYEPGAFDIRSGEPILTRLGERVRELADSLDRDPPPSTLGWWEHPGRLAYPPV